MHAVDIREAAELQAGGLENMEKIRLNDTWVKFPFVPYPAQENFISKLLESLKTGKSALLESPTGTGKTLCLLCGSLAWLDLEKKYQEVPDLRLINESDPVSDDKISLEQMTESDLKSLKTYKIYFCSRTHSQIRQAIHEFQNTGYQHLRSTVLASRRHLCIHPSAQKAGDKLDNKCRKLRKSQGCSEPVPEVIPDIEDSARKCGSCKTEHPCPFYKNFEEMKKKKTDVLFTMAGAFDQKSLIEKCKKYRVCPFYMSRYLKANADIIFLPYSYIFNPHILKGLELDLKNAVIIIDEGHNIESVCEVNASFDMTVVDVENCRRELNTYSRKLQQVKVENPMLFAKLPEEKLVRELEKIMIKLRHSLESMEAGSAKTGQFCLTIFSEAGFTKTDWPRLLQNLRDIAQFCGGNDLKVEGMRKIQNVVYNVYFLDCDDYGSSQEATLEKSFQFFKEVLTPEDEEKGKKPKISFWCFDAGVIMRFLQKEGVHSFIVTSGTLSPLPPLRRSLGITFEIELQNDHVIKKNQVLALSIASVDGTILNANYENRQKNGKQLYPAFGKLVLKVANFSPKGLLVFFTSGKAKEECLKSWGNYSYQTSTLYDAINKIKPIHEEPKDAAKLPALQKLFSQDIEDHGSNGACMIGVLRGKVSEGLDFKDDLGRAVIIFGIPYLNCTDDNIFHKKAHIHDKNGENAEDEWYTSEAVRPVNQALGRIIRHQGDYGVVVLADERYTDDYISYYTKNDVNPDLPGWLKETKEEVSFSQIGSYLGDFFEAIPSKMKDIKIQIELEQENMRQKHKNEMEKEEYPSNSFHALGSMIAVEKEKNETLRSEIYNLGHKVQEACAKTNELQADIAKIKAQLGLKESTNTVDDNSDCESTGDGEWLGDSWE